MPPRIEKDFPNLAADGYEIESPIDSRYNCIAWAAGDNEHWWEPYGPGGYYWPPGIPRDYTLASYQRAFARQGYRPCENNEVEEGYEKVTLFVDDAGMPTHAARQKDDGSWTSKLGQGPDIKHTTPHGVEGDEYGTAALIMRRRKIPRPGPVESR